MIQVLEALEVKHIAGLPTSTKKAVDKYDVTYIT